MYQFHVGVSVPGTQFCVVPHPHKLVLGAATLVPLCRLHHHHGGHRHLVQELLEVTISHTWEVQKWGKMIKRM